MDIYEVVKKAVPYLINHRINPCKTNNVSCKTGSDKDQPSELSSVLPEITPESVIKLISREKLQKILSDSRKCFNDSFKSRSPISERDYEFDLIYESNVSKDFREPENGPDIYYGIHPTRFGKCLIGITQNGICHLSFALGEDVTSCLNTLKSRWKGAAIRQDQTKVTSELINKIFGSSDKSPRINLYLRGTVFQLQVWNALMMIPRGSLVTYSDLADYIKRPKAIRAVSNAVASNPISFLIPCHRVIRKNGDFHNYRWGMERKIAMIIVERYG